MGTGRTGIFEYLGSKLGGKKKSTRKPVNPVVAEANKFHAVKIKAGKDACEWARALKDHRFLATEAPKLPLDDCDADVCTCKYAHFKDRRKGPRRGSDLEGHVDRKDGPERRMNRGRRQTYYEDEDSAAEAHDDSPSYYNYTEEQTATVEVLALDENNLPDDPDEQKD